MAQLVKFMLYSDGDLILIHIIHVRKPGVCHGGMIQALVFLRPPPSAESRDKKMVPQG